MHPPRGAWPGGSPPLPPSPPRLERMDVEQPSVASHLRPALPASSGSGVRTWPINTSLGAARVTPPSPDRQCLPARLQDASPSVVLELPSSQRRCNQRRHHRPHQHQTSTGTLDGDCCASGRSPLRRAVKSIPSQNIAMFSPPSPHLAHWRRENNYASSRAGRKFRNLQRSG